MLSGFGRRSAACLECLSALGFSRRQDIQENQDGASRECVNALCLDDAYQVAKAAQSGVPAVT